MALLAVSGWVGYAQGAAERMIILDRVGDQFNVSPYMDFVSQQNQVLTIEDIINDQSQGQDQVPWIHHNKEVPGFGFDNNTFWFRLSLRNGSSFPVEQFFEIKNPVLDEVIFYQVDEAGKIIQKLQTGDQNPTSNRPFFHHNLIIPFKVPSHQQHFIYFRVTTSGSMEFPISLWSPDAFHKRDQLNLLLFGALFGIMGVMAIYNLFIYALFREVSMVFYAGFSFCLMLFLASIHGFAAQYLWPNLEWLRGNSLLIFIPLTVYFALMFTNVFLQMERSYLWMHRLIVMLGYFNLGLVLLAPFIDYTNLIRLSAGLVIPYTIGGISIGIFRWWQGYGPARFFVIAWTVFLAALCYYSLVKFGVFPATIVSDFALQFGAVSEAVLFAFALADRMNSQRKAYLEAQAEAFAAQKAANEELEQSVAQRTQELRTAMDELEQANSRLQTLSMQDGLTGIRNRRYFDEKLEKEWQRCLRHEDSLALLLIDIDFFKAFNDKYGHLAGDECLKMAARAIEDTLTRPSDCVARYGGEEFVVILPETRLDGAIHVAESIRATFAKSGIYLEGETAFVTVSIGVAATKPSQQQDPQSLLAIADQSLYKAKSAGRNCVKALEN